MIRSCGRVKCRIQRGYGSTVAMGIPEVYCGMQSHVIKPQGLRENLCLGNTNKLHQVLERGLSRFGQKVVPSGEDSVAHKTHSDLR